MKIDMTAHSQFFTIQEMIKSPTAEKLGIDNTPDEVSYFMLRNLMSFLDMIRTLWNGPIYVNSGYRCPELNNAVGGSKKSQHLKGQAADITTGNPKKNKELFDLILKNKKMLNFDQLIDESDYAWIHISKVFQAEKNRNQVLHL